MKRDGLSIITFCLVLLLVACSDSSSYEVHLSGRTMGTLYNVKYVPVSGVMAEALQSDIDQLLVRVNELMSTYDPHSELSRFNQFESTKPFPLSKETLIVMQEAFRLGKLSDGALDVTIDPIIQLWGFGEDAKAEKIPTNTQLRTARLATGIDKVILSNSSAEKLVPNVSVNLSTVAKGYGVDVVGELLKAQGISNFLVEIGGETIAAGVKANGSNWRVAIEKPIAKTRAIQKIVPLNDQALATSGDYRIYFEEDGVRYSHLINPQTGKPISHNLVSVSVMTDSCMTADGLATTLNVMGFEKGFALAEKENIAALFMIKEGDEFKEVPSSAFNVYMQD